MDINIVGKGSSCADGYAVYRKSVLLVKGHHSVLGYSI